MSWEDYAACRPARVDIFFPEHGDEVVAKRYCATCLVRAQCLDVALQDNLVGIWGGTNERERKRIVRRYVKPTALERRVAL